MAHLNKQHLNSFYQINPIIIDDMGFFAHLIIQKFRLALRVIVIYYFNRIQVQLNGLLYIDDNNNLISVP